MRLKESYAKTSDKAEDKVGKSVISDDVYAVCEFLENLADRMESARLSAIK